MNNNYKSATTAGLLGIFLGAVGAHDWYLGDRKKGTTHVILAGAGFALIIIADVILPNALSFWTLYKMLWLISIMSWVAWALIGASELWGFIEGIKILTAGDAGLAQRGFMVNPNTMNSMNNMNNMNPMNGMNMGAQNNFGAQNSMNQQENVNQPNNIDGINNPNNQQNN